jgi:hypothetical protein
VSKLGFDPFSALGESGVMTDGDFLTSDEEIFNWADSVWLISGIKELGGGGDGGRFCWFGHVAEFLQYLV